MLDLLDYISAKHYDKLRNAMQIENSLKCPYLLALRGYYAKVFGTDLWIECFPPKEEVAGSNPAASTKFMMRTGTALVPFFYMFLVGSIICSMGASFRH